MCFKIGRVKIKISFLFFAMLTMAFIVDEKQLVILTLLCSALHEMGHICALFLFGSYPDEINFGIFGVRIQQNKYILSELRQAVVVLCGPLVNIILFVLFLLANLAFKSPILLMISAVNFVIGGFNLLPVLPLDGGRILLAVLNFFMSEKTACKIMRIICACVLSVLIFSGILLIIKTGMNISLLATVIYISILCIKSIKI